MTRFTRLGLSVVLAACLLVGISGIASAQMVPDTADPYELAPQNVHLYPVSLNARIPYYYLPPIFAPAPMWRGAMDANLMRAVAPHNWTAYEIPESTALVAWGAVKDDKSYVLESANQQEFIFLPPQNLNDNSWYRVRTEMRAVPKCSYDELEAMLERELLLEPGYVNSIADQLPVAVLLTEYERIDDVADMQVHINEAMTDEMGSNVWPVDRIYANYSGWRRDPNRRRSLGDLVPWWFTVEGKIVALKHKDDQAYLLTVEFSGYNPWYPIETAKNVMRRMISLSFDEFSEVVNYYDVELPLSAKEYYRQGSGRMEPYHTRTRWGTGSEGQGAY